jgi:NADH dehydrogenase (ubiquinone) Fe-S protein 6
MLRQSIQRISTKSVRQTCLKSFTAAYTTTIQTSAKPIAPEVKQAENRTTTWSKSQRAKADALVGPRFEQMDLSTQVKSASFFFTLKQSEFDE